MLNSAWLSHPAFRTTAVKVAAEQLCSAAHRSPPNAPKSVALSQKVGSHTRIVRERRRTGNS